MIKSINLDMDGTIADLYAVPNWLNKLEASDPSPYKEAKAIINLSRLARYLNRAKAHGIEVNIISWLSKGSTAEYDIAVIKAKKEWLDKHLPSVKFDNIHIIPYGEPKSKYAPNGEGINFLVDDEEKNIIEWRTACVGYAFAPENMYNNLPKLF